MDGCTGSPRMDNAAHRPARERRGRHGVTVCSWAFLRGRCSRGCGRGGSSRRRGGRGGARAGVPVADENAEPGQPAPVASRYAGTVRDARRPGTQAGQEWRGRETQWKREKGCAVGQRREPAIATGTVQRRAPPCHWRTAAAAVKGNAARPERGAVQRQRKPGDGNERGTGRGRAARFGERDVNADGAAERELRPASVRLPERVGPA